MGEYHHDHHVSQVWGIGEIYVPKTDLEKLEKYCWQLEEWIARLEKRIEVLEVKKR